MDRTYNVFVDNGLYIASYYLQKNIEDITIEDLTNNKDIFAEKVYEFIQCDKYSKLASMGFNNSSYAQPSFKSNRLIKIKEQYTNLIDNIGEDEVCIICGEKHIKRNPSKKYLEMLSRSIAPYLSANTFVNYSNNLQMVNVCPVCIFLTMISILNMRKSSNFVTMFISDDSEFMEDYTYQLQVENNQDILSEAKFDKNKDSHYIQNISNVIENIINNEKIYNGYIETLNFYNGQIPSQTENFISKKQINFISNLKNKNLFSEFKQMGLMKLVLDQSLKKLYISYLIDRKENKLKCSQELFDEVDTEVWNMRKETLNLIKNTCNKLKDIKQKDEVGRLKEISNINQFESLINEWVETYNKQTGENLFNDIEDFELLCNPREINSIKNRMICQFLIQ